MTFSPTIDPFSYAPQLRPVPANLLSTGGWLRGQFRVPQHQALVDYIGSGNGILKFTRVSVPGDPMEYAFVGLRREALVLIEPTHGDDELLEVPGAGHITKARHVTCLLEQGHLIGTLQVLVNVRVSDYLRQAPPLLLMRDCTFEPHGDTPGGAHSRSLPVVLVNLEKVIGVAERDGTGND